MAAYQIITTDVHETAISRQLKIDNGKLLEAGQAEMTREQWVQRYFEQQMRAIVSRYEGERMTKIIRALQEDPVKLAEVEAMVAQEPEAK